MSSIDLMHRKARDHRVSTIWAVVGILGGVLAIAADLLSVFNAHPDDSYVALSITIPDLTGLMIGKTHPQLLAGHYLSLIAVPLESAGVIIHAFLAFRNRTSRSALMFVGFGGLLLVWGTAYHATYGLIVEVVQHDNETLIRLASEYYEPLGTILTVALMLYFGYFALLVLAKQTVYQPLVALVSPIAIMLLVFAAVAVMPQTWIATRAFFTVTAMNLPLVVWLIIALVIRRSRQEQQALQTDR